MFLLGFSIKCMEMGQTIIFLHIFLTFLIFPYKKCDAENSQNVPFFENRRLSYLIFTFVKLKLSKVGRKMTNFGN